MWDLLTDIGVQGSVLHRPSHRCTMPCSYLLQGGHICDCDRPSDGCAAAICCVCRLSRRRACGAVSAAIAAAIAACAFCFLCFLQPRKGADVARQRVTAQLLAVRQPNAPDRTCTQVTTASSGRRSISGTQPELTFAQELMSRAARGWLKRQRRQACMFSAAPSASLCREHCL